MLKILQHDKIWGDNPPLQILGRLVSPPPPPVIYAHDRQQCDLITVAALSAISLAPMLLRTNLWYPQQCNKVSEHASDGQCLKSLFF